MGDTGRLPARDSLAAVATPGPRPAPAAPATLPAMSVIVATERYETVRTLIRHLRAQTVREQLEIVIAAPSAQTLGLDPADLEGFHSVRVVEIGPVGVVGWARAAGVRQATAPIVALTESHAFPVPGWAEALIAAHRQPWAAVGPSVRNANPVNMISWTSLFMDYGLWVEHAGGEVGDVPGHNSAYKREIFFSHESELTALMEIETMFHWALRRQGHRFCVEPGAAIYHVNVSLPSAWLMERWHAGRVFAATRARGWSWGRRLLFTAASPAIPLLRARRILRQIRRAGLHRRLLPRIVPVLVLSLLVSAAGEMIGYAAGAGRSWSVVYRLELHKLRFVSDRERQEILSRAPAGPAADLSAGLTPDRRGETPA